MASLDQLTRESFLSMTEAAQSCPNRPSVRTVWRWARQGIRGRSGVRFFLETWKLGGHTFTSREALARFFSAIGDEV